MAYHLLVYVILDIIVFKAIIAYREQMYMIITLSLNGHSCLHCIEFATSNFSILKQKVIGKMKLGWFYNQLKVNL